MVVTNQRAEHRANDRDAAAGKRTPPSTGARKDGSNQS